MRSNLNQSRPLTLNPAAKAAVKAFRDAKPWRGTEEERLTKFTDLHRGLTRAYDMETILERDAVSMDPNGYSVASHFDPRKNRIILLGRLSAVTYLFCFAMACGQSRNAALRWAKEIFRHFFPRSFAGCREVGGCLIRNPSN